jgi:glycosyltransferase involved in cell wall biosynthesis
MDAMTMGFLENGAQVKVLTASTHTHPIRMDELDPAYLDATDLEAVRIETELDIRDAYVALMNRDSYTISRFYAHHHAMVIKQALSRRRYDVIQLESLYTTPYINTIRRHAPNALISLRSHNHEYQVLEQRWKAMKNPFKRAFLRLASNSLERYEKDVLDRVDVVVAISQGEADGYRNWGYSGPMHVSSYGVDTTAPGLEPPAPPNPGHPLRLFHVGAMDWSPNREGIDWFIASVWPILRSRHPDLEFHIAGKSLHPLRHADVAGVVNHGEVPDSGAFATERDLLVIPLLRGAGIRVKIVQAMANGIAVATTTKGGHGLGLDNGEGIALDHPDGFADCISEIVRHPERLGQLGEQGMDVALTRFDRRVIARDLMEFYGG